MAKSYVVVKHDALDFIKKNLVFFQNEEIFVQLHELDRITQA